MLRSDYFGPLECADSGLFHFPNGIPGFECERDFAPIEIPAQRPLVYLQSINRPDLCLITLPVRTICPEFELHLQPEDVALLGFPPQSTVRIGDDVLCLAIVSVDTSRDPVANLLAPLVVNLRTHEAVQAIQADSAWTFEYPIAGPSEC
jgi:flagellar assembly factor FliW